MIADLEKKKSPILITQYGKPAAYLLSVTNYETLLQRVTLLEGIARGERAIEQGRVISHQQAKRRLSRWLK